MEFSGGPKQWDLFQTIDLKEETKLNLRMNEWMIHTIINSGKKGFIDVPRSEHWGELRSILEKGEG